MKPEEIQDENMEDIVYRKVTKKEKAETINENVQKNAREKDENVNSGKTLDTMQKGGGKTVNTKEKEM